MNRPTMDPERLALLMDMFGVDRATIDAERWYFCHGCYFNHDESGLVPALALKSADQCQKCRFCQECRFCGVSCVEPLPHDETNCKTCCNVLVDQLERVAEASDTKILALLYARPGCMARGLRAGRASYEEANTLLTAIYSLEHAETLMENEQERRKRDYV